MWQYILPILISGVSSGIGSALEKPRITQKSLLDSISKWQEMIRQSAYAGVPLATQSIAEMAGKVGLTNESQAGMRYAEISDLVSRGEMEAAKFAGSAMLEASKLPGSTNWFTEFLKGFFPGASAGADISALLAQIFNLEKILNRKVGNVGIENTGRPYEENPWENLSAIMLLNSLSSNIMRG